ncbi:ATP-binding protein [Streptomyces sp. NPDC059875]|uniref:ATP-binding protein n=1 Tax=unclassified Streptomyces TaxID=2593676 RepID=UPI00364F374E
MTGSEAGNRAVAGTVSWEHANRDHLMAELAVLRSLLAEAGEHRRPGGRRAEAERTGLEREGTVREEAERSEAAARQRLPADSALDRLATGFGLSGFERSLLLLTASPELVAAVAGELHAACGSPRPSFGTALALLPGAHWSAATPEAPLRRWHLLHLLDPSSPVNSPLAVDERVLHHLTGTGYLDTGLAAIARPVPVRPELPAPLRRAADAVVRAWSRNRAVLLSGPQPANLRLIAGAAGAGLGRRVLLVAAADLPADAAARRRTARLMERETVLSGPAWAVSLDGADPAEYTTVVRAVADLDVPVAVLCDEDAVVSADAFVRVPVGRLAAADRVDLLRSALRLAGASDHLAEDATEDAATTFDLTADAAEEAARDIALGTPLWQACRERARSSLPGLARVLRPTARWDDLVVPDAQAAQLRALVASVRHRTTVLDDWGFADRTAVRDQGATALFAGPSGTGKSFAAEVVAGELGLDLVQVDLSQVTSKYIGETEKNLHQVFAAAEDSAAVLLFDEADALFGRRAEVHDSHDRYANLETAYLLQRLERFRGLAILTTNARSELDRAFTRRLRTVVNFPHPDLSMREALWRRAFPPETPVDGLDPADLARLDLAGGEISSVALAAAYLAAADQSPVTHHHVVTAARWELAKSGRSALTKGAGG